GVDAAAPAASAASSGPALEVEDRTLFPGNTLVEAVQVEAANLHPLQHPYRPPHHPRLQLQPRPQHPLQPPCRPLHQPR
ncbi:hypothetical protein PMAYCL1PPCAC_32423, partial [Pristionchus mayeri]